MQLKSNCGAIQVKGLGIHLTQNSTEAEIASALVARPDLAVYIDGAPSSKTQKDVKK